VFSVVGIFAESADAGFRKRKKGGQSQCCPTAPMVAPVSGCGGCGAGMAVGYPGYSQSGYYQPNGNQAFYPQNGFEQPGNIPPTSIPGILPAASSEVKVALADGSEPKTMTIAPGTTVRWVNDGKNTRMVSSVQGDWTSEAIAPGQEFTATFTKPGTFEYFCGTSKDVKVMKSTIIVK